MVSARCTGNDYHGVRVCSHPAAFLGGRAPSCLARISWPILDAMRLALRTSIVGSLHRARWGWATLVCLAALSPMTTVDAQCEDPPVGPVDVLPAVGAPGVTIDAWVRVRYVEGYFGPDGPGRDPASEITLLRCGACGASCDSGTPVSGHVEVYDDNLFFVPDAPLEPRTQYGGEARGPETSLTLGFCTGSSADASPPSFASEIRVSSEEVGPGCELPDGGFRVGVFAGAASDDGPGGSLEYLLFLTRADGLAAPLLVDRVRNFSAGEITLRLFLDGAQAASPVCVRLGVVDGVGNVTMSNVEECFDPVASVAFQGCTIDARSEPVALPALVTLALVTLLVSRARRRSTR